MEVEGSVLVLVRKAGVVACQDRWLVYVVKSERDVGEVELVAPMSSIQCKETRKEVLLETYQLVVVSNC